MAYCPSRTGALNKILKLEQLPAFLRIPTYKTLIVLQFCVFALGHGLRGIGLNMSGLGWNHIKEDLQASSKQKLSGLEGLEVCHFCCGSH